MSPLNLSIGYTIALRNVAGETHAVLLDIIEGEEYPLAICDGEVFEQLIEDARIPASLLKRIAGSADTMPRCNLDASLLQLKAGKGG